MLTILILDTCIALQNVTIVFTITTFNYFGLSHSPFGLDLNLYELIQNMD